MKKYRWLMAVPLGATLAAALTLSLLTSASVWSADTAPRKKERPPPGWDRDPLVAAAVVSYTRGLLERWSAWCAREVPDSGPPIQQAYKDWIARQAPLLERAPTILRINLSYEQRDEISRVLRVVNQEVEKMLASDANVDHVKWCMDAPGKMRDSEIDFMTNHELVRSIMEPMSRY
jgi:hypothetical protein